MLLPLAMALCIGADASVVSLSKGSVAPFDGQLLDMDTAARLVVAADFARRQAGIELREAQSQGAVETQRADALGLMVKQRGTDLQTCDAALGQCRTLVDQHRSGFASACLWGGFGILAGAALGALAIGAIASN